MRKYFLFLLLACGTALPALGQNYDCRVLFSISATGTNTPQFDNRSTGCDLWTMVYQAANLTGLTLTVQSSFGPIAPGAWGTFSGTVLQGINPNTSTTGAQTILSGFNSWLRVNATFTDSGGALINGVLYGFHSGYNPATVTTCPGTAASPCVVDGPDAAGAAPTKSPVLQAGQDGSPGNVRTLKTDANGQPIPANASSADADGISNTQATPTGAAGGILYPRVFARVFNGTTWDRLAGNTSGIPAANASLAGSDAVSNTVATPTTVGGAQLYARMFPYIFNGTTNDRQFSCPLSTNFSISAGTDVVIAAGVASTNVKLCQIVFNGATTADYTIRQGTGSTCGTNTASLASLGQVTGAVLDLKSNDSALSTTVQARDMCLHASTSVTILGTAFYAQF